MGAIKKQIKEFWLYFRLLNSGCNTIERGKISRTWLPAMCIIFFLAVFSFMQMGLGISIVETALLGSAMYVGTCASPRPSALSVAPFSPVQRIVFSFLSCLLMSFLACLAFYVIAMTGILLVAFVAFCINGENIFTSMEQTAPTSGYGLAFNLLFITFFFFSCYAVFQLEGKRNLTVGAVVLVVCTEILALVMTNLCANAALTVYEKFTFTAFANVPELITNLAAPWAVIVVLGVMNALAIALAIILSVRRFKSDKV